MDELKARELIRKYKEGTLTEQESALLESWYLNFAKLQQTDIHPDELEIHLEQVWEKLPYPVPGNTYAARPLWKWIAAAAAVILVCSVGILSYRNSEKAKAGESVLHQHDALPGDNKAMLTLASGEKIMLDKARPGKLADEGGSTVIKTKQGEIIYKQTVSPERSSKLLTYNSITTPRAGQYQVKLPDGTNVWLNAESSIRFPTVFSDHERIVEIKGEVYFEVAKKPGRKVPVPFRVLAGNQIIEVLGTRFNVNSYTDEGNIKTTLFEGSIKLKEKGNGHKDILLSPGQQAMYDAEQKETASRMLPFKVTQVDIKSVIAWKNGYFRFDNIGLPELMRQLSRWYDVEVIYEGPIREYEFVGQIERGTNLSKVLRILELGGVRFRIQGKKIIVTE